MSHYPANHPGFESLAAPGRALAGAVFAPRWPAALESPASRAVADRVFARRDGGLWVPDVAPLRDMDTQVEWRDDFITGRQLWYDSTGSGGVVGMTESTFSGQVAGKPGNMRVSGGATIGGYAHAYTNPTSFLLGAGCQLEMKVSLLGTLTGCTARIGWGDATGDADVTDGMYVEYLPATTANWRRATASNNTRTKNNSSLAVATGSGTYVRLMFVWKTSAEVEYFVNGVSIGTETTNLPTASGRDTGIHVYIKNAQTDGYATVDVDWVRVRFPVQR